MREQSQLSMNNRPNGLYKLFEKQDMGQDQSLLFDTINSTALDNKHGISVSTQGQSKTEAQRRANNSTLSLRA